MTDVVMDGASAGGTDSSTVALRPMELSDVDRAVALHMCHLPAGFFVQLGPRFLAAYYRSYLSSRHLLGRHRRRGHRRVPRGHSG